MKVHIQRIKQHLRHTEQLFTERVSALNKAVNMLKHSVSLLGQPGCSPRAANYHCDRCRLSGTIWAQSPSIALEVFHCAGQPFTQDEAAWLVQSRGSPAGLGGGIYLRHHGGTYHLWERQHRWVQLLSDGSYLVELPMGHATQVPDVIRHYIPVRVVKDSGGGWAFAEGSGGKHRVKVSPLGDLEWM